MVSDKRFLKVSRERDALKRKVRALQKPIQLLAKAKFEAYVKAFEERIK